MMDKTVAGLLGAVGALVASTPGHAAPQPPSAQTVLQARSYAELLRPVPNALATLRAIDGEQPQIDLVQLGPVVRDLIEGRRDHHHHHHRRYIRHHHHHHRYYHHHHRRYDPEYRR